MKKQLLILFAFISVLALSQVPQRFNKVIVTGDIVSPKYIVTNSNNDSVLLGAGGRKSVESFKTDTSSLSARINTKEPLLPSTPASPETKWLNGNRQWAEIVLGSGGYASNVYFTNLTSTIVGTYKQTSGVNDVAETIASGTCNNNEVLIHTYLFEQPVGITTIDAGVWRITLNSAIDASAGDSKFKFVQYKRSAAGVETDMFTVYSNTIENRVGYEGYLNNVFETVQPSFTVEATDRLGCRVYATTTAAGSRTLSYKVGDGFASYLNTPLVPRHDQFRDKNGNPLYQHLTSAQVAKVDATSGLNTGDETLTSIKTKLGAATAVSDGYLRYQDFADFSDRVSNATHTGDVTGSTALTLATVNSNVGTFNNITINAKGLATAGSNVSYEPSFPKNTAFNKSFGTTPGTVLEGRTLGTAANSAVGDFIQNQNSSAQSANMWISGRATINGNIEVKSGSQIKLYKSDNTDWAIIRSDPTVSNLNLNEVIKIQNAAAINSIFPSVDNVTDLGTSTLGFKKGYFKGGLDVSGAATFSSTVNSTGFLLNGNNLTSSLSTNSILKWNGSNFVNSLISDDGGVKIGNGSLIVPLTLLANANANTLKLVGRSTDNLSFIEFYRNDGTTRIGDIYGSNTGLNLDGNIKINETTAATSPTTGALVVNGGIGAGHVRANNFYGNGSNLTGIQLPITLTTNGTSGAATFSGNVLNVPNYGTSTALSGVYTATFTPSVNITMNGSPYIIYTRVGSVYHIAIAGAFTSTGGDASFRFTLPSSMTTVNTAVVVSSVNNASGNAYLPSYNAATDAAGILITIPNTSSGLYTYKIMADYY